MSRISSGRKKRRQSCVPLGSQFNRYSAPTIANRKARSVRFSVATTMTPPGITSSQHSFMSCFAFAGPHDMLGEAMPVIDRQTGLRGVQACNLDIARCRVDANYLGTALSQRFAEKAGATAHVQNLESAETISFHVVSMKMARDTVDDVVAADRVELVDGAELSIWIPPFLGQGRKAFDLGRFDRFRVGPGLA